MQRGGGLTPLFFFRSTKRKVEGDAKDSSTADHDRGSAAACQRGGPGGCAAQQPDPRTVQTDGAVRTILRVGSKVYIGGSFTSVAGKPRSNLAAINANTGGSPAGHPRPTAGCAP